jgi:hypothetical protein
MKEKWKRERLEQRAGAKKHSEQYKNQLMTDKDFQNVWRRNVKQKMIGKKGED